MKTLRVIFAIYMTCLMGIFVPVHKRGMITMGPREADSCCAPVKVVVTCCEEESQPTAPVDHKDKPHEPTQRDIANCAVCFWSAIALPITFANVDLRPTGMVDLANYFSESALIGAILSHEALPRGPPALI